jgi:hypothetical protein
VQSTYVQEGVSVIWSKWCKVHLLQRECLRHGVYGVEYLFYGGRVFDMEYMVQSTYATEGVSVTWSK